MTNRPFKQNNQETAKSTDKSFDKTKITDTKMKNLSCQNKQHFQDNEAWEAETAAELCNVDYVTENYYVTLRPRA